MPKKPIRAEHDTLGKIEIPADALYGPSTARAVENFPISGVRLPAEFLQALATVKACAATVNGELKTLDRSVANTITKAAEAVASGKHDDAFPVDIFQTGSGTSTNMNMNEVIATLAGKNVHPNDHVNCGQSSNDVFPTALHIAVAVAIKRDLLSSLTTLEKTLKDLSKKFASVEKIGRTHLQDAVPVTLGLEFGGYARQVECAMDQIEATMPRLLELPIGGTAVGTGLNAHPQFGKRVCALLAKRYDLHFIEAVNHMEAQASRDACVAFSGALRSLAIVLRKIADDIRWMASGPVGGLNEIQLPALQPGSSIMPGKVNPVLCETLLQVCAQVMGCDATVIAAAQLSNFELNVGMPVMAHNVLFAIRILTNAVGQFEEHCLRGITANEKHMKDVLQRNPMLATALNPYIGYDRAAAIAKRAMKEKRSVREIAIEEGVEKAIIKKAFGE